MMKIFKTAHKKWQIPLTIALLVFGILLTAQYRTNVGFNNSLEAQSIDDLSNLVISLSENRTSLHNELVTLKDQLNSIKEKANAGISLTNTLTTQARELKIITGTTAVEGSGVSITITGDSPILYLDLIDIVNELFNTGAEVVSINDIRITQKTSFQEIADRKGNTNIYVAKQKMLYPIVIKAIGNPDTLEKGLTFNGGIINNLNVFYGIYPTVKKEDVVKIPAEPDSQKQQNSQQ